MLKCKSLLMPARCRLAYILQTMKLAESVITQLKLHLPIHCSRSKIAHRQLQLFLYIILMHTWTNACKILVKCVRIQFPFSVDFEAPHVFSAYYTPLSKSRRFLTLINAFLRLRSKKAWDGKKCIIRRWKLTNPWSNISHSLCNDMVVMF